MKLLKTVSASFLFFLCVGGALAFVPTCNDTIPAKLQLENARPYNDVNASFTFYAYYTDQSGNPLQGNNTLVYAIFQNTTVNFTNLTTRWSLTLISSIAESVDVVVYAKNNNYTCLSLGFNTKWRTPFNVNFQLYKQPLNSSDPASYMNDFQYVVLVDERYKNGDDLTLYALDAGMNNLIDNTVGWLSDVDLRTPPPLDRNTYFWGRYLNGQATVKLYEPGNYTVYVMNNKVTMPFNYFYEFERPTTTDVAYMGNIYSHLKIYNQTNVSMTPYGFNGTTFKISFSKFEANTYYAVMNIFTLLIVAVVYFGFLGLIIWAMRGSDGIGSAVMYYLIIATPIALGFVFYIN